jgi:hypothetical protein
MPNERTWWGTLRGVADSPKLNVLIMIAWIVIIATVAVIVGNKYGQIWGYVLGIFVGPLVMVRLIRSVPSKNVGKHQRKT